MKTSIRPNGFTGVEIVLVLTVIGIATWIFKPSVLPGASKRAATSASTTTELIAAKDTPAAQNAAGLTVLAKALNDVPDSPATSFARNEVPIMLARGPGPDATELLLAERRRVAFMQGQLEEQRRLTAHALNDAQAGKERAIRAERAKAESDQALAESAATEHARSVQMLGLGAITLFIAGLWLYAKFYGISPSTLGNIAADVRAGAPPIQAMDTHLAPWLHAKVNRASRLATPHAT